MSNNLGSIFKVKGSMLCVAFVEPSGTLISNPSEPWRDEAKETRESRSRTPTRPLNTAFSTAPPVAGASTASDSLASDNQYTVMVSEKQARVVSLPSQTCVYRVNLAPNDQTFVVTANVINLKGAVILIRIHRVVILIHPLYTRWTMLGYFFLNWIHPSV